MAPTSMSCLENHFFSFVTFKPIVIPQPPVTELDGIIGILWQRFIASRLPYPIAKSRNTKNNRQYCGYSRCAFCNFFQKSFFIRLPISANISANSKSRNWLFQKRLDLCTSKSFFIASVSPEMLYGTWYLLQKLIPLTVI